MLAIHAYSGIKAIDFSLEKILGGRTQIALNDLPGMNKIPMPPFAKDIFDKIAIKNIKTSVLGKNFLVASGEVDLFGLTLGAQIREGKSITNQSVFSVSIGLPEGFKLSNFSPELKALDILQLTKGAFVFSTGIYQDTFWDLQIQSGFNLIIGAKVAGKIEQITKMIGAKDLTTIVIAGNITPLLIGSQLTATLPGKIGFGIPGQQPMLETIGMVLGVYITELAPGVPDVTIGIGTGLQFNQSVLPTNKGQPPLVGSGQILIAPEKAALDGAVTGVLKLPYFPLGIGNLKFKATIDYAAAIESSGLLALSGLGLGGEVDCGDMKINLDAYFEISGSTMGDMLLNGEIDQVTLPKFVECLSGVLMPISGNKVNLSKLIGDGLPPMGLEQLSFYFAPKDMRFGQQMWKKGISGNAIAVIPNPADSMDKIRFQLYFKMGTTNLMGVGYMSKLQFGPLVITGAGRDKKMNTKDDGPLFSFTINPFGAVSTPSTTQEADAQNADLDDMVNGKTIGEKESSADTGTLVDVEEVTDESKPSPSTGPAQQTDNTQPTEPTPAVSKPKKSSSNLSAYLSGELDLTVPIKGKSINIFKTSAIVDLRSPTRLAFDFVTDIYNGQFQSEVKADLDWKKPTEWILEMLLTANGLATLGNLLRTAAQKMQDARAQLQKVDDIKKQISDLQKKFDDLDDLKKRLDLAVDTCRGKAPKYAKQIDQLKDGATIDQAAQSVLK